jgi:hypothetical protein
MGLVGAALFAVFGLILFVNLVQAARAVRRRKQSLVSLEWWLVECVILVVALFSHTLEGPMAAIPFWTFLGLAVAQKLKYKQEPAARISPEMQPQRIRNLVPAYSSERKFSRSGRTF